VYDKILSGAEHEGTIIGSFGNRNRS